MRNFKRIVALMIVLLFSISVVGCGSKTVAEVDGQKITQDQLDKRMKKVKMSMESQGVSFTGQQGEMMIKALEQQSLDDMITQALIEQAAKKQGVYPSKSEVKKAIDEIIASFGGKEKFDEALKTYNYTTAEIEELKSFDIAKTNLFDKVTKDVKVSDNDIKQWYDTHKDSYKDPAKIKAKAILVKYDDPNQTSMAGQPAPKVGRDEQKAKKLAEDIIAQLNGGADFAKLAKEKSEDEFTKDDGGQVKDTAGNTTYGQGTLMPKAFDDAAVALKVGTYSKQPVKVSGGFYIIKLESLTPEKQLTFDEAKAKITQELPATRKQEKFTQYLTDLRNKAKITNKLAEEAPQAPATQGGELPPGHPSTDGSAAGGSANPPAK